MLRRFFHIDTPDAIAAGRRTEQRAAEVRDAGVAFARECGFDGAAVRNDHHGGLRIVGLISPQSDAPRGWKAPKSVTTREGKQVYLPDMRLKAGKEYAKRLRELPKVYPSGELLDAVGVGRIDPVFTGTAMHYAVADFFDGEEPCVLLSVPFANASAPLPDALIGATELTEHWFHTRVEAAIAAEEDAREALREVGR